MQLLLATACALLAAVTGSMALPQAAQLSSKFAQIEITYTDSKTSTIFVEIKSERVQSFQPICTSKMTAVPVLCRASLR